MKKIRTKKEYQWVKSNLSARDRKKLEKVEEICLDSDPKELPEDIIEKAEQIFWGRNNLLSDDFECVLQKIRSPLHRLIEYLQGQVFVRRGKMLVIKDEID